MVSLSVVVLTKLSASIVPQLTLLQQADVTSLLTDWAHLQVEREMGIGKSQMS